MCIDAAVDVEEDEDAARWHVIKTRAGKSVTVAQSLDWLRGFSPLYELTIANRNLKKIKRVLPVFPKYCFARWDGSDPHLWHHIRNVKGVTGILGGANPEPIRDVIVDHWITRAGPDWVVPNLEPVVAAAQLGLQLPVRMEQGPFASYHGVTQEFDEKNLLVGVKLSLLGRPIMIWVPPSWCSRVEENVFAASVNEKNGSARRHSRNRARQWSRR